MTSTSRDIAILGYACRLPQADTAEEFWSVLERGDCVVGEIQPGRWALNRFGHRDRKTAGKSYTWRAGQLDDPFGFDPTFFGISPREAIQMDPQQRILLQVVWEALEHAGIPASRIAGSETGVYVGASSVDYSNRFVVDPSAMDIQMMTGNTLSIVSNRISYVFDLKGPSFTVDTACSSSVVALHEALEAMRAGRIDTAIVGGVNMLLSPFAFVGFSRASMLSPSGLCRAFDAAGDGYVRSEGAVAFVLKTVEAARAAGDPIRGVLVGSGINSDGRTVGLSLPSSEQQAALLSHVYERFEIDPTALAYIEAHGTGTRVGDPAEAQALGEVLGRRRDEKLPIGSVKTNIGHLEAASGMAGLLKAQLILEKGMLPASLHFTDPNPDIAFDDLNIEVVTGLRPLAETGTPLHVGVNSFGFGGANAHAVLRQPARHEIARERAPARLAPLVVSAQSPEALKALAADYRGRLDGADAADAARITNAAAFRRDRLDHRLMVLGSSAEEIRSGLDAWLAGTKAPNQVSGRAAARNAPVAFVFSGNGSQWAGMGRAAYQSDAAFRTAFDTVTRLFMRVAGWSLLTTLFSEDLETDVERTEVAQPLLFAVQVATVEALAVRGLKPDMVSGHSVGEVAAAWAAGALSLESAVYLIHVRSTQQEVTRHLGGMAALLVPAADARKAIADAGFSIEVAADNSPRSITLSGSNEEIAAFAKVAKKNRWALKKLKLDYPFHCALIDPIRPPLVAALATLQPHPTRLPYVSAVTGRLAEGADLGADYWWLNVRQPVLFRQAMETLAEMGAKVFVEIGPKPVLQTYVTDTLAAVTRPGAVIPTLDTHDAVGDDTAGLIVARAFVAGASVDDMRVFGLPATVGTDLPRYPWQNQPYRIDHTDEAADIFGADEDHPLLGYRVRRDSGPWIAAIDTDLVPWLADHKVETSTVFPAAGFVEAALAAACQSFPGAAVEIRDFDILRPLVLEDGETVELKTEVDPDRHVVEISSRRRLSGDDFALHVRARIAKVPVEDGGSVAAAAEPTEAGLDAEALYTLTRRFGLDYGPAFRRARAVVPVGEASLRVTLSAEGAEALGDADMVLHPTLLDASFHGLFYLITRTLGADGESAFLPVRIGDLRVHRAGATPAAAIVTVTRASPRSVEAEFTLVDGDDRVVARASGVRFKAVRLTKAADPDEFVFTQTAVRLPDPSEPVELPAAWSDPAARLEALELVADDAPELGEGALLLDAGSRALAWDVVSGLSRDGAVDPAALAAEGVVSVNALPLLNRLVDALEEDGALERTDTGAILASESPYPAADAVIATLVAAHPRRIAEATTLVRLAADLPRRLASGLVSDAAPPIPAGLVDHLESSSPSAAPVNAALAAAVLDLAAGWPADRPLRLVLVGPETPALARRLAALPKVTRVVVTDPVPARLERIRLGLVSSGVLEVLDYADLAAETAAFDVLAAADLLGRPDGATVAGGLAARLASGAAVLFAEPDATLFSDLVSGQTGPWWSGSVDPAYPVGPRRNAAGHQATLESLGFRAVVARPLASDETNGALLVARAPLKAAPAAAPLLDPVLVLTDRDPACRSLADALAATVAEAGRPVRVAVARRGADGRYVLEAVDAGSDADLRATLVDTAVKDLVYAPALTGADTDPLAAAEARVMTLHGVLNGAMTPPARLWILAPGGSGVGGEGRTVRPVETALWGLGRVVMNEYPAIETRLVDLAVAFSPAEAAERIGRLLGDVGPERELVVDERGVSAVRIVAGPSLTEPALAAAIDGPAGRALEIERQGTLDGVAWHTVPRHAPDGDAVEIEVTAAGLNFRDVMWALGLLPEEALEDGFAGATLGMECSGVVTRTGPDVRRFKPGDRVIAFAPACFATHVHVAEKALAPVPAGVDLEAAATIPVTFLTAWYALVDLAHLDEGETVLIHGGAGGVGLAALQIALSRGARVVATAGSPEKRRLLSMLGAAHVLDSRSLAFADEVMAITGGKGVDVVLNSLFGEAMERSLEVLTPFGRFIELGKRDYYANTRIGLRPFRQNLSYFGVDADQLLTRRPKLAERLFRDLVGAFESGVLTPLPYRVFPAERITEAFRLMQQSGHIGKILVLPPEAPAAARGRPTPVRADGTYLVAGGLGGFGVETARLLVARGARSIVLTSRSGTVSPVAAAAIAEMEAAGAAVRVTATDITDRAAVDALLAGLRRDLPPLRGVLHTAMVLDDALFQNLDGPRMRAVMAPKIAGAAVLDAATRGEDLDLFVLYSSATTLIGNPGQAPYVAANAYLEGLARARRAAGMPALAVAWGAIADAGYLARNADVNDMLSMRLGKQSLTAKAALTGLGLALDAGLDRPVLAYARIDWAAAKRELPIMATPLAALVAAAGAGGEAETVGDGQLAALIEGLDGAAAVKLVTELLAGEISRILRLPVEDIDPARPLTEVGMDSLMALELRMAAEQRFGIDIPLLSLANGAALGDIARRIVEKAGTGDDGASADSELAAARHMGEEMDDELAAVVSAIEAQSGDVKRLTD